MRKRDAGIEGGPAHGKPFRPADAASAAARYGYAAASIAVATFARLILERFIGYHHPYVTFYVAVLWSAWYGGWGPALLATGLGAGAAGLFVLPSLRSMGAAGDLAGVEFYFIVSLTGAILFEAQRRAERAAAHSAQQARSRLQQLEHEMAERARAEEAATEAEELLRLTFEHAPVGICQVDLQGSFLEVNPRFCAITGYTRDELRRRSLSQVIYPDAADSETAEYARLMAGQLPFYRQEREFHRRDGTAIWTELALALVRDARGRPHYAIAVLQDVTDRKRSEERLREAQRSESVGLLAGGIAHDFNNLLTAVLGNAFLALDTIPPQSPNSRLLRGVIQAAERAAHLTRELLAYAGAAKFSASPVDLSEQVRKAVELLRPSLPESVELRLELKDALPRLQTDPAQIRQIVTNLLINSAEAIGAEQPGLVTVKTDVAEFEANRLPPAPHEGELAPGRYLLLSVHDTGAGIDGRIIRRIFEPFFTTKFMGRGLGLAAVSGIVRAERGVITVSSEPGRGSTFTLLLPAG
ncbi:MAG: PAS domain S-box protein [Acidobacteriia bacterium]|nr:PAS domain S-box protein [Terriglobia bacterium]